MALMASASSSWSQTIQQSDSSAVINQMNAVFHLFTHPDLTAFKDISTEKIYCIICFDKADLSEQPYMLDRKDFFLNYLKMISGSESFLRAKQSNKKVLIKEDDHRSDITILFTTYTRNELAPGHEGGQMGFYFKKVNGIYKFSGVETIP